jgi:hypothetical protein
MMRTSESGQQGHDPSVLLKVYAKRKQTGTMSRWPKGLANRQICQQLTRETLDPGANVAKMFDFG